MWLINATTLQLEYVNGPEVHPYAILSHTWGEGEVSFQDMANLERAKTKPGFSKIGKTCTLALESNLGFAWVDTCCIDKNSSAELTEAINSMFQWYRRAAMCFVYLTDLKGPIPNFDQSSALSRCHWFTRGLDVLRRQAFVRLQEAIARESTDLSLFAWDSPHSYGAFAESPAAFGTCSDVFWVKYAAIPKIEYTLTNKGLLIKSALYQAKNEYILMLHCDKANRTAICEPLGLRLARTAQGYVRLGLMRESLSVLLNLKPLPEPSIYIPKTMKLREFIDVQQDLRDRFSVRLKFDANLIKYPFKCLPMHLWDGCNRSFITSGKSSFIGLVSILGKPWSSPIDVGTPDWEYPIANIVLALHSFGLEDVRPWTAIFSSSPESKDYDPFKALSHQDASHPYFLYDLRSALEYYWLRHIPAPVSVILRPTFKNDGNQPSKLLLKKFSLRVTVHLEHKPDHTSTPYEVVVQVDRAYQLETENSG